MNKVILIGNLTRDPEISETHSGIAYCKFTIAVNRQYQINGETQTDFLNCTAWRGQAENISKYCQKGSKVAVFGSLKTSQYEGNDGVKRTVIDIVAQEVTFLCSLGKSSTGTRNETQGQMVARDTKQMALQELDEDLPF